MSEAYRLKLSRSARSDFVPTYQSINDQSVANIDQAFTYDGIGRLTASTGPWGAGTFQYDGLGNLRQRSVGARTVALSYDVANRLTSHTDTAGAGRSLTYDNRGNVLSLGRLSFTYDASDQPVATLDAGPPPGTVPASDGVVFDGTVPRLEKRPARVLAPVMTAMSAVYDGHMRRVKSVVGLTRYSVYDASGTLIEIDELGGAKTDYIRASGMTLARIAGSTVTWLHHDHLGSAVAGTNAAGAVVWRESEQPFGEDWTSAAANDNQAGYTGHVEDAATGLTYMQARYYDPVIGRFLSIDPVGFSPGRPDMFNRYAYAANDSVNMVDPNGMDYGCRPSTSPSGIESCRGFGDVSLQAVTDEERKSVEKGDIDSFWKSRAERGDPIGELGEQYGKDFADRTTMTKISSYLLSGAILNEVDDSLAGSGNLQATTDDLSISLGAFNAYLGTWDTVRQKLAEAHILFVDSDQIGVPHFLSAAQITEYHHDVFSSLGLRKSAFGGTPITGADWEAALTSRMWCDECDSR